MPPFNNPLISIITPTYNHEVYIAKCIESVIGQTYKNWEMLIIDDGSIDKTAEIAKNFSENDSRIKYYYQQNKGLYKLNETYNFALKESNGEYIAILEGDDYWFDNKLETQINDFLQNPDIILCWSRVHVWLDNIRHISDYPKHFSPSKHNWYSNTPVGSIYNILLEDFPIPLTWVIKKKYLDHTNGFIQTPTMPTVDMDTLLALSKLGSFKYTDEALGVYRRQQNQATNLFILDITKGMQRIMLNHYDSLTNAQKQNITFTRQKLVSNLSSRMIISYSKQGRSNLIRRDFKSARKSYINSIMTKGNPMLLWRLRSLIGLLFSFFRLDIESLAKALGKVNYK